MGLNLDWKSIRPINGSRSDGFEKFCSQLARTECPPDAKFEAKGNPDAGVECYCVLADGSEWGWQAKYFDRLDSTQWSQIDESIKTALEKHPNLVRYYVCVPMDRADARVEGRTSAFQQWQQHEDKWRQWATARGMSVSFVWWGESELINELSKPEHLGRLRFWFDERQFSPAWFRDRLSEAIRAAGPRYTPNLNVDLPIVQDLDLFGRTESAFNALVALARRIRRSLQEVERPISQSAISSRQSSLSQLIDAGKDILSDLANVETSPSGRCSFAGIAAKLERAESVAERARDDQLSLADEFAKNNKDKKQPSGYYHNPHEDKSIYIRRLQSEFHGVRRALLHADDLCGSTLLILTGQAGTGKTHLLCDWANRRISEDAPIVLLMGQRFRSFDDPWSQALAHLDMRGISIEEFVSALEAAAEASNERALVVVDALNEGCGYDIWPNHLDPFLAPLEKSPWIGVILSVRTPYEDTCCR